MNATTKQMNGYTMEQRIAKYNRPYWVGIIGGKVVAKASQKVEVMLACAKIRQETRVATQA